MRYPDRYPAQTIIECPNSQDSNELDMVTQDSLMLAASHFPQVSSLNYHLAVWLQYCYSHFPPG